MIDRLTPRLVLGLGIALAAASAAAPALAQGDPVCQQIRPMLDERRSIVQRLNALGTENVDPRRACSALRDLQANGTKIIEFLGENQTWCQIPNDFATGMREDHERVGGLRTQACRAAAQLNDAERQARRQQEQQQFGGPGLTGRFPIPQGAL